MKKTLEELQKAMYDLTPEQAARTYEALVKMYIDDEAERIAALSPEELDAELRAKGFDPAVERAKGEALIERLRGRLSKIQDRNS